MTDFVKVDHFVDLCFLILFSLIFQFDKYTPKLDNPFIRHSNVSLSLAFEFKFVICIWQIKYLTYLNVAMTAFIVVVILCVHMLQSCAYLCMILVCVFLCFPSSSFLPSSSPPIPPPCQACPRCSHTQDPSARCKEPSSPRSAPHPYPQPTIYKQTEWNLVGTKEITQACTELKEKLTNSTKKAKPKF